MNFISQAIISGHLSGNGEFTKKCHLFFEKKYKFKKVLLTSSCTDALEMAAILLNIKQDDEVIVPSFTFVSTANAFVLRGAKILFADSEPVTPNIDPESIEELITEKTRAIIVVHYAGIACNMDRIMRIASRYNIRVIEDAAHSIDSYYRNSVPLGSIGNLAAFSFHETKNLVSGEGGMLVINDDEYIERAEIIWEKGTNRIAFQKGEVNKYGWKDIGSSFLPSEITAAFLLAQTENIDIIQKQRKRIWNQYYDRLRLLHDKGLIMLPALPDYATNNAHMFYLLCSNIPDRDRLLFYLKENGILAVSHYLPLHLSEFYCRKYTGKELARSIMYSSAIVRLPLFFELTTEQVSFITDKIYKFFNISIYG